MKKEEDKLEEQVMKKEIELEAKEKALDKKVIDEIVNKTAEIIDAKVKVLAEDLKKEIVENAITHEENPSAALKRTIQKGNQSSLVPNENTTSSDLGSSKGESSVVFGKGHSVIRYS